MRRSTNSIEGNHLSIFKRAATPSVEPWKSSPPPLVNVPVQYCRSHIRVQQAREPLLELFEPSPKRHHKKKKDTALVAGQSQFKLTVRPKHLSDPIYVFESGQNRKKIQSRIFRFSFFSITLLAASSLLLTINQRFMSIYSFGKGSVIPWNSNKGDKRHFLYGRKTALRSKPTKYNKIHPQMFFFGGNSQSDASLFKLTPSRKITLYPAEFTDVTQLYSVRGSDDSAISGSMELRSFPEHETSKDCVPMSLWHSKSFRECNMFCFHCQTQFLFLFAQLQRLFSLLF